MTYKKILPIVIGMQSQFSHEGDKEVPDYVYAFLKEIANIVSEEKDLISTRYNINISESDYRLPYNYLLGKLASRDQNEEVKKSDLMNLLSQVKFKIQYDLLSIAVESMKGTALLLGDADISR